MAALAVPKACLGHRDKTRGMQGMAGTVICIPHRGLVPPSVATPLPGSRDHGGPWMPDPGPRWPLPTLAGAPLGPQEAEGGPGRPALPRPGPPAASSQPAQPCCKVLTHTEHSLSPRTLLAPSSSCADILIVLLWELAGSLSSGMARRGARAGCWLRLLLREAAHSDRLSNNLNLLRRACGTPAGPLYLLH